ncbi:MAG: response regulator transcription factor [Gammaproteobacteria bacterium]|nr:response regulator transcription factor [Gammaproteobacteria bacterium]
MSEVGKVFVVDDDEAVRDSIGMLLDSVDMPYTSFHSADQFLSKFDESQKGCLVLDIRMPGMSGLDLQQKLVEMKANIPIVFITGHGDIPMAVEAMRRGAIDFIRKPFRDQELLDRINEALHQDEQLRVQDDDLAKVQSLVAGLTDREQQVFERVCEGQANKVMAIELGISERTVEIHRSQVMHKTGARSLAALVRLKLKLETA